MTRLIRIAVLWLIIVGSFSAYGQEPALTVDLGNNITMEFVRVSAGTFVQGSPDDEPGRESDETAHRVTLSEDYFVARMPVTVAQFRQFVSESGYRTEAEKGSSGGYGVVEGKLEQRPDFHWKNPGYTASDLHPVTIVTFGDATEFLKWLSGKTGRVFSLPTESQWEYACRGGTTTRFFSGAEDAALNEIGWHQGNSASGPKPVGEKAANAYGLLDMSGNVYEWCRDTYNQYPATELVDPLQTSSPSGEPIRHVLRGGSWMRSAKRCRSAARYRATPGTRNAENGFRVVTSAVVTTHPAIASKVTESAQPLSPSASRASSGAPNLPIVSPNPAAPVSQHPPLLNPSGYVPAEGSSMIRTWISRFVVLLFFVGGIVLCLLFLNILVGSRAGRPRSQPGENAAISADRDVPPPLPSNNPNSPTRPFRIVEDGFWITTSMYPPGSLLWFQYWADEQWHDSTVQVSSPDEQFVYTGTQPQQLNIQLATDTGRRSSSDPFLITGDTEIETTSEPRPAAPQTYVVGNPLFDPTGTRESSDRSETSVRPENSSGSTLFPPAY